MTKPLPWLAPAQASDLSDEAAEAAQAREKRFHIWDPAITGFALRVYPTGSKVWIFRYRSAHGGRSAPQIWMKLGDFPGMRFAEAVSLARKAKIEARRGKADFQVAKAALGDEYRAHLDAEESATRATAPKARPLDEWHEDMRDVTWWRFPVDEAPWIGSPLDSNWPGYHTHFTPLPPVPEAPAPDLGFVDRSEGGAGRTSIKKSHRAEGRNFVD